MPHASEPIDAPGAESRSGGPLTGGVGTKWFVLGLIACVLLASGARFWKITEGSFFNDELYSVTTAANFEGSNLSKRLGYVPTRIALELANVDLETLDLTRPETWRGAGITEWSLRVPHAVIGVLTIPLLMLAGRRVLGDRGTLAFGVLLAVSQWHVYWSQNARFYIVQFLFFNLAVLLWCASARQRRFGLYALAMACAFLGFWSQPQALLVFAVMGLDWIIAIVRKDPIRLAWWQWGIGAVSALSCAGVLGIDLTQRTEQWSHFVGQDRWLDPHQVVLGMVYWIWPATAVFAGLAGLWLLAKHPRRGIPLVIGAALPPLVFTAMAPFAFVGSRYAFMCLGPVLAIAGVAAARAYEEIRPRAGVYLALAPGAAVVFGQLVALGIYFRSGGNFHVPMGDVAAYITERNDEGLPVYSHEDEVIRYYAQISNVEFLPRTPEEVAVIDHPAWFVFQVSHRGVSDRRSRVPGMTFEHRFSLVQIHSSAALDVYRYDPPAD